ncbi:MAG: prolipoprotein diacylglyceryl transferase [Candidatus Nanoarchaeia archaeon]
MFAISPNPILLSLGPIDIRYYGLVYALGFLFGYWYLRRRAKQNRLSLLPDQIDTYMIYIILGGILGGRIGEFLFFQTDILFSAPLEIFKIWTGGMSIHGGMLGFIVATYLFCKKYNTSFYEITDHIVIPTALVLAFGRVANFINAELIGTLTTVPWCVNYFNETIAKTGKLACRHPSQLYESLKNILIFVVLFMVDKKQLRLRASHKKSTKSSKKTPSYTFRKSNKKSKKVMPSFIMRWWNSCYKTFFQKAYAKGYTTWLFILLYGLLRTIANIWRDDVRWLFGIFGTGQVLSIIMFIIAFVVLCKRYWCAKEI